MAAALLGYFSVMVTTLAGMMLLLNTVLSLSYFQPVHQRPYPVPVIAEAAVPDQQPVSPKEAASVEITKPVVAAKNKRVKVASRDHRRKGDFARWQQDREHSLVLGYAEQSERQPGALFEPFGTRRF